MLNNLQKYYYDTELIRQLWCKINEAWNTKWAADFGGTSLVLGELKSKDKFYDALKADIFAVVKQTKGERIAKNYIIEKDTIENHLKSYKQQNAEVPKPKPFLRDKARNAYAYYLGYEEGYAAYTKLFDFETLQSQYQPVPVLSKALVANAQPSEIALVRIDKETDKIFRVIERGEEQVLKGGLLMVAKRIAKPIRDFGIVLLLYYLGNFAWNWYQSLPLFTAEQLAGVKFYEVFSTNSEIKATKIYGYDAKSLNLSPKDTITVTYGINYTNDVNGNFEKSVKLQDTLRGHQIWKPTFDTVRLFAKGKEIKKLPLYVPSKKFVGWGWGQLGWYDRLENYENICVKGTAHIPKDKLEDRIKKSYYTQFKCIDSFPFAIDTCTFAFRVKNPDPYAINLNDIGLHIGSNQAIFWGYFASKTNIDAHINIQGQNYMPDNLHEFAKEMQQNVNEWKVMEIKCDYPIVRLSIDGRKYQEYCYKEKFNRFYYFYIYFKGSGMIDWVKITGKSGKELYFEDFGGKAEW
jgi:hypothetical protein